MQFNNRVNSILKERKISLFMPSLNGGGAQRVMVNIANGMVKRGLNVDLVLAKASGEYLNQIEPGVHIIDLNSSRVIKSFFKLSNYIRREKPYILFSALEHANICSIFSNIFAGYICPVVVCVHSSYSRNSKSIVNKILYQLLAKLFYRFSHAVVTVSKGSAQDLINICNIPEGKIKVIYNPVITRSMHEKSKVEVNHKWFTENSIPIILSVGRLEYPKDFSSLIYAFAEVRKKTASRLLILGEGKDRQKLELLIDKLGLCDDVEMPGFVDNPYKFMSRSSVFVLSSESEALPTVLIEAMALGCPVIATDCPNGPREILEDGKYGKLVPVGDVPALANEILSAINSAGKRLMNRSDSSEHIECYTLDSALDKYLELIK